MMLSIKNSIIPLLIKRRQGSFQLNSAQVGIVAGLALAFSLLLPSLVLAANEGNLVLNSRIEKEVVLKDSDGKERVKRVSARGEKNLPGDEIIITVLYKNRGKGVLKEAVINNPLPKGTAYKINSAKGKHTLITFSADGGRTFAKEADVKIVDDSGRLRKAKPEEMTHVKWKIEKDLKPAEKGQVSFRATIKK